MQLLTYQLRRLHAQLALISLMTFHIVEALLMNEMSQSHFYPKKKKLLIEVISENISLFFNPFICFPLPFCYLLDCYQIPQKKKKIDFKTSSSFSLKKNIDFKTFLIFFLFGIVLFVHPNNILDNFIVYIQIIINMHTICYKI